jgi:hypothetical protein
VKELVCPLTSLAIPAAIVVAAATSDLQLLRVGNLAVSLAYKAEIE